MCYDKIFMIRTIRNHWKDKHRPWSGEDKIVKQSKKWASMVYSIMWASIEVSFLRLLLCSFGIMLMISWIRFHKYLLLLPFIIRITVISPIILWLNVMILISIHIMEMDLCIGSERLKSRFNVSLISALYCLKVFLILIDDMCVWQYAVDWH